MAFDGFFINKLVTELKAELEFGRVNKINNISNNEFIFTIRKNKNKKLLISLNPQRSRLHITSNSYENPKTPSNFCTLLRKHLTNALLESIEQINNDRIIELKFRTSDELGYRKYIYLIAELMGKHSNLILTDENKKILDSVKNDYDIEYARATIAGLDYKLPPTTDKINPFDFEKYNSIDESDFSFKTLLNNFYGVSKNLALQFESLEEFKNFCKTFDSTGNPIALEVNNKADFYFLNLRNSREKFTSNTYSELLDLHYMNISDTDNSIKNNKTYQFVTNRINKLEKKIIILEKEIEKASSTDIYQIKGNLLLANNYLYKNFIPEEVELQNFYSEDLENIKIKLDPSLSIEQNAEKYFNIGKKNKKKCEVLTEQIEISKNEISYFKNLESQIEKADLSDLEEIKEELLSYGYIKEKINKKHKKTKYTIITYEGTDIYVGKNNLQNDAITNKLAKKSYLWFHIKDLPGSHVVVFDDNPSEDVMNIAAMLAAYYSKSSSEDSAIVDYTQIRYVKKIPFAKKGMVTYTNQTSIKVKVDKALLLQLLNN
ncbi:MAG: NFACT RNA binding domain-containing protein [Gemella sp.]|nr:NFACT RNA binding domain-containing protein [Gemella sp.]